MRIAWLLSLVLAFAAPAAAKGERIKALVLDVNSKDLKPGEVETLTSLVTAHLSRYPQLDVLSGADIKRLVDLEAQKQSAGCDEGACLAELAGAMGAQLVLFGQAGKLGNTLVVTLNVFDAAKGQAVARQPIEARDLGQLPSLIGPAVDAMVRPLLQKMSGAVGDAPPTVDPVRANPMLMGQRAKEVFDQQQMDVCVDDRDRVKWWFCDKSKRYTENDFIRTYKKLTGKKDLDKYEQNRNPESITIPTAMVVGGAAVTLAAAPVAWYTYVDKFTVPALSQEASGGGTLGDGIVVTCLAVGLGVGIYGGLLLANALEFTDGKETDHSMKEPKAREAIERYNEALADKISKEYATTP